MKKVLLVIASLLLLTVAIVVVVLYSADGRTDLHYGKLISPKQSSMILGNSKASRGIIPSVVNRYSKADSIYNFAFDLNLDIYSETYVRAISSKLSNNQSDAVFVITVDPWSISENIADDNTMEEAAFLSSLESFSSRPHFDYLFNHYQGSIFDLWTGNDHLEVHENGWQEIKISETEYPAKIEETKLKIASLAERSLFSEQKLNTLNELIVTLKEKGRVHLVVLPVHPEILEMEQVYMPDFGTRIRTLAGETVVPLFDMSRGSNRLTFTDGLHMDAKSAEEISYKIGSWIERIARRNPNSIYQN